MHDLFQDRYFRVAQMILFAAAAWTAHPSNTAVAAPAHNVEDAREAETTGTERTPRYLLPKSARPLTVANISMIELLVIACHEENCREVSLLYDPYQMSLMTCMSMGQHEAARWQASNPKWAIKRWSCRFRPSTEKTV